MTKKISRTIFAVSIVVVICCAALFTGVLYNYFSNEHNKEIQNEAMYIAQGYYDTSLIYLENVKQANPNTRITLISADGTVLYDSEKAADEMENHADREEVREALQNGTGDSVRYSKTLSERTYYYALVLNDGNILRVSNVRYSATLIVWSMVQPVLVVCLIAVILSLILASTLSKRLLRPLNELDLDNPDETIIDDEFSPLIRKIQSQNKKIEQQMLELKKSQQEFRMITENMSEGLIIIDHNTDIVSYNTSAGRIFGNTEIAENESAYILNRSEAFRNAVGSALDGQHCEQLLTLNGRKYNVFANPVLSENKPVGAVIVILDVTEKEERDALRREFTANVSHELKTPLTSISGYAEIIENGIAKAEDIPHFAQSIHNESKRLISLVEDIIKISRLDEGVVSCEKENVDIYEIAKAVITSLDSVAEQSGVSMMLEGESTVVYGAKDILFEMIYNLCDNAIKYNKKDGSVKVTVSGGSLSVADTGIGIPEADKMRVFERFYRVDKSHSKEIGGTGLGLSIVKHGAIYHNAKIDLQSEFGKGTTIKITF